MTTQHTTTTTGPPIKAVTWNVYMGTKVAELRPILRQLIRDGVEVILMQEAGGEDIDRMIEAAGWETFTGRRPGARNLPEQYRLAWAPSRFDAFGLDTVRLGSTAYYRKGGDGEQYSDAVTGVLRDKLAPGKVLHVMSYHTPAHVQVVDKPPRRWRALVESAASWRRFASGRRHVLIGGDDNVDERFGNGPWRFMRRVATGLRQVQAPSATHGKRRRIDDFRVKGLRVGPGFVRPGGGDHRLHGRTFTYR